MTSNMETFTRAFLAARGIELEALARHAPPVGDDECLALMGSITEGLANDESDIDLLYLGDGGLRDKVVISFRNAYTLGVSHDEQGYEINVEQLTHADLEGLAEGMSRSIDAFRNVREMKQVAVERDPFRLRMVHRLGNCLPLVNPHVLADWQARIRTAELPEYLAHSYVENLMNQEEDIIGELKDGHFESALWMAKTGYVPRLVAAMLASVGETNQHSKWHLKLLRRHRTELGPDLVDAILAFLWREGPHDGDALVSQLAALSQPALHEIFVRNRNVRRAVLAFSHTVRYNSFANPDRWSRTVAGAA